VELGFALAFLLLFYFWSTKKFLKADL